MGAYGQIESVTYSEVGQASVGEDRQQPRGDAGPEPAAVGEVFSFPEGVRVSPAGPTNRQGANRQRVVYAGGEDTIDLGWCVRFNRSATWREWRERLRVGQEAAKNGDVRGSVLEVDVGESSPIKLIVQPCGVRKGLYFSFWVEGEGWQLFLMDREDPAGESPNVRLHVGSSALVYGRAVEIGERVAAVVREFGGEIISEKISRIDAAVDLLGVDVTEFVRQFMSGQVVRRGRKGGVHFDGNRFTGITVGRGDIVLRIYDKRAECREADPVKWDLLVAGRYGGEDPERVTRVEFQCRRGFLVEMGVSSGADWQAKRAAVLDYLLADWFRLTAEVVDRENTERFGPSALWGLVAEAFADVYGAGFVPVKRQIRRGMLDRSRLIRQAVGCLTSAAAVQGRAVGGLRDVLGELRSGLEDVGCSGFEARVIERAECKRILVNSQCPVAA